MLVSLLVLFCVLCNTQVIRQQEVGAYFYTLDKKADVASQRTNYANRVMCGLIKVVVLLCCLENEDYEYVR